jgi:hypothetical protein
VFLEKTCEKIFARHEKLVLHNASMKGLIHSSCGLSCARVRLTWLKEFVVYFFHDIYASLFVYAFGNLD